MRNFVLYLVLISGIYSTTEIEGRIRLNSKNEYVIETSNFLDIPYIATAFFTIEQDTKGWNSLAITTNKNYDDNIQSEAAGRLEAYLTKDQIYDHFRNARSSNGNLTDDIKKFFKDQEQYVRKSYKESPSDPYYYNAYQLLLQFDGLRDEYNLLQSDKKIDLIDFYIINAFGDIFDIKNKFNPPNYDNMTIEELKEHFFLNSHCSGLFKANANLSDLFFGHNSWFYYTMMNRIFKEYNFNYNHYSVKAKSVFFASYPGCLTSNDDFYISSKDIGVIETTNVNYNNDLYKKIVPESLLCWQRTMIANRMSESAKEWADNFAYYNSGSYNNMYMALDMNKIDLDKHIISPEALFTVETLPEEVKINDVTTYLRLGYWPSYNTPFDKDIIFESNIDLMIDKKPELKYEIDYDVATRATIFRRDQGTVTDLDSFKKLMRSNNYKNDPLARGSPINVLAARGDISTDKRKGSCFGAYDAKVASVKEVKGPNKKIHLIAGPSSDGVEAFQWSKATCCAKYSNYGLSDTWNYDWFVYNNRFSYE